MTALFLFYLYHIVENAHANLREGISTDSTVSEKFATHLLFAEMISRNWKKKVMKGSENSTFSQCFVSEVGAVQNYITHFSHPIFIPLASQTPHQIVNEKRFNLTLSGCRLATMIICRGT